MEKIYIQPHIILPPSRPASPIKFSLKTPIAHQVVDQTLAAIIPMHNSPLNPKR
ncbi:MAG: hypothetical protein QXR19_07125 [Candidatus Jordarchaeaceae archaeon]